MVRTELGMAAITAKSVGELGTMWLLRGSPASVWETHGAELGQVMSDGDFHVVIEAAMKLAHARALAELSAPGTKDAELAETLDVLVGMRRRAQDVLVPLAYPDSAH
jgi:hypothetical protein